MSPSKTTKLMRGLMAIMCKERLREVGRPTPEKRWFRRDLLAFASTCPQETGKSSSNTWGSPRVELVAAAEWRCWGWSREPRLQ